MLEREWHAGAYVEGAYIQSTVASRYLERLQIKPSDVVLDVGCGDGSFSLEIIKRFPMASFLGIDNSANMLALAKKTLAACPYASVQEADMTTLAYDRQFDYIVSFWCMQWAANNLQVVFEGIYNAMKRGGRLFALFPTGDDPFATFFEAVKETGRFKALNTFKPPMNYTLLQDAQSILERLPFKEFTLERHHQSLVLPSLDTFRKFVNGIAFFQGQMPEETIKDVNAAMVDMFAAECQKKYQGEWHFDCTINCLTAEK